MRLTLVLFASLVLAACDPQSPVESTDVDSKVAEHNQSGDHPNLTIPIGRVTGDVTTDRIADGTIGAADLSTTAVNGGTIQDESITASDLQDGTVGGADLAGGVIGPQHLAVDAVQTAAIDDLAVITTKLNDNAVTTIKIGDNQITGAKILDGEIANGDIGANAVTTAKIMDGQVQNGDLGADAVTSAKILDGEVGNGDLGANAVTNTKIMDGEVTTNDLAANAVTSAKITDLTIVAADLADGAVTAPKVFLVENGRVTDNVNFVVAQAFQTGAGGTAPPAEITVTLFCGAEAGTAGTIRVREGAANIIDTVTCPANSAANPLLVQMTFASGTNNNYVVEARAGAAASAVVWRGLSVVGSASAL